MFHYVIFVLPACIIKFLMLLHMVLYAFHVHRRLLPRVALVEHSCIFLLTSTAAFVLVLIVHSCIFLLSSTAAFVLVLIVHSCIFFLLLVKFLPALSSLILLLF